MGNFKERPWYALRVSGEGFKTFRRRIYAYGPEGGSHRFTVPDIDDDMAIEVALRNMGVEFFIPCGFYDVKHKRKANTWNTKRVPLIPGYVFVRDVRDWTAVRHDPNVMGVMENGGKYLRVPDLDIHHLRMASWECYQAYHKAMLDRFEKPRKRLARRFPVGTRHTARHRLIGDFTFNVLSVTGKSKIRVMHELLGKLEIDVDDLTEAA